MKKINFNHIRLKPLITAFLILLCAGCSGIDISSYTNINTGEKGGHLVIWAHSDIQPREKSQQWHYEKAVQDMNENLNGANIAVVAGDIIQFSNSPDMFEWYVNTKKKSSIKYWYEIAGNHDHKDFKNYKKYINMPMDYSVKAGNLLILFLSDENKKAETFISDSAFRWWKKMVMENQGSIIITVTHGYLKQSNLFGSIISSRNIKDSKRFADVLKKYRVDLWLCGHTHLPHYINGRVNTVKNLNGTLFINVSGIRKDPFMSIESIVIFFKKGSDHVLIRSRNHEKKDYNTRLDIFHKLGHKFNWDGNAPVMEAFKN